jgi:hypothetical protein
LIEHAHARHYVADLPKFLWPESIQHAVWLKNHTSTYLLDSKTPYELLFNKKPDLINLPEWGAKVWVLKEDHGKLDEKADKGPWVGYSRESQAHQIYWPVKQRMTNERNVAFNNNVTVSPSELSAEN